jgi:hypothetical protein
LHKYTESIYQQYCQKYTDATYIISVEWRLRHYHASKKIILSALFYTQARYLVGHNAKNLSFYSMYYSLFSALSSNILILPSIDLLKAHRVSHSKVFDYIENYFVKHNIYNKTIIELLNELRLMREVYSYHLPLGGAFHHNKEVFNVDTMFERLSDFLPVIYKISDMLSYFSYYAWEKKLGDVEDLYHQHQTEVDTLFFSLIEHHDHKSKYCLIDDDDYRRQSYFLTKISSACPISWLITEKLCEDLECGWDDGSDVGYDINEVAQYLACITNA